MIINKVTITGADNKTNFSDLKALQDKYPFVEWAILFSKSKGGTQRYPDTEHIEKEFAKEDLNLAAHFCGWYSKQVLEDQNFSLFSELQEQFKRVQINYNLKNSSGWDLNSFLEYAEKNTERCFILQYNKSNSDTLKEAELNDLSKNVHFLHDGSGGRGTVIKEFQEPFHNIYTGYAGGINSNNILEICAALTSIKNNDNIWIDMESGVRTDNEFDLNKVETILDVCSKFITQKITI